MKITKIKLDDELHKKFKSEVAKHGSNMQETMVELITKYLEGKKETEETK